MLTNMLVVLSTKFKNSTETECLFMDMFSMY